MGRAFTTSLVPLQPFTLKIPQNILILRPSCSKVQVFTQKLLLHLHFHLSIGGRESRDWSLEEGLTGIEAYENASTESGLKSKLLLPLPLTLRTQRYVQT